MSGPLDSYSLHNISSYIFAKRNNSFINISYV